MSLRSLLVLRLPLLASLLTACAVSASGAPAATEPARKIRVGFFAMKGYHMVDGNGCRSGYGYDLLQMFRPYTGWEYEYVGYEKGWPEMLNLLKRGEIDLLTNVSKTPEREQAFDFSTLPLGYTATLMTVKAGSTKYRPGDYAHWNGMRVGFIQGNSKNESFADFAREKGFTYTPVLFPNVNDLTRCLQAGELDAIVTGSMREVEDEWVFVQLDIEPFYAVVRKGNRELLGQLNRALEVLFLNYPDKLSELRHKYYLANKQKGGSILFSTQERAFVEQAKKQKRKFEVLVNPDRRPFSYFAGGKLHGIIADVLGLIAKRTGLQLAVIPSSDRETYRKRLLSQQVNIVADLRHDHSQAEKTDYLLTEPYLSGLVAKLLRKDFTGEIRTAAVIRHSNMETVIREKLDTNIHLVPCDSSEEVVRQVKDGSVDAGYLFTRMATEAIYNDLSGSLTFEPVPSLLVEFCMGLPAHSDPLLISIIAKAVNSLSQENIQAFSLTRTVRAQRALTLRDWLASHHLLTISTLSALVLFFGSCFVWIFLLNRKNLAQREEAEAAERKAEEGAEWLHRTLNAIGDGVITTDERGRIIMLNPVGERMTGFKQAEAVGKPHDDVFKIVRSIDGEPISSPVLRTLRTGVIVELANHTDLVSRNGHRYHISDSSAPILDKSGAILGAILIFHDVSEQYERTEQLRKAIALMETGSRLTHAAAFELELVSRRTSGSKLLSELWPLRDGYAVQPADFVYREDVQKLCDLQKQIVDGKLDEAITDYRSQKADGMHYYHLHLIVDERKAGYISTFGIIQDVTKIKQTELQLQDTLSLWKLVIDSIPLSLYVADADKDFTSILCNRKLAEFFGKEPEEITNITDARFFNDPACFDRTHRDNLKAMQAPEGLDYTETFIDPNGMEHVFHTIKKPLVEASGRRLLVAISSDITESKRRAEYEALNNRILLKIIEEQDFNKVIDYIARQLQKQIILCDHVILAKCNSAGLLRFENEWRIPGSRSILEAGLEQHYKLWDANIELLRQNKIFKIADMHTDPITQRLTLDTSYQTRSTIITPIFENGRHWGSLLICSHAVIQNPELSAAQEALLRACGNAIAIAAIRHQQENEKSALLANEQTIHYCLEVLFGDTDTVQSIAAVLKAITRHFNASGTYIHQILPEKHAQKIYAQYTLPGETPLVPDTSTLLPLSGAECWLSHFHTNETLSLPDITRPEQRDMLRDWREAAERTHAHSLYIARIMSGSELWGTIGVLFRQEHDKPFSPANFAMLKSAAHLVEIMLQRRQSRAEILSALTEARTADAEKTASLATEQAISSCLETLFEEPDIGRAMTRQAEILQRHFHASHCYFLRYDLSRMVSRMAIDVAAPDEPSDFMKIPELPILKEERWFQKMVQHQHHNINDLDINNTHDPQWRQTIHGLGVRSLYLYPVFCQGQPWGNLGLAFMERNDAGVNLSADRLRVLEVISRMIELRFDREEATKQTRQALVQAQSADKAKSFFIASVSHEIRTPLNAVIGFAELLRDGSVSPKETRDYLDSIAFSGNALLQLINDVLDLSKLEADRMEIITEPVDLKALCETILRVFQPRTNAKGVRLLAAIPDLPVLRLDKLRIRQILFNLLGNAVKFTPSGSVTIGAEFTRDSARTGALTLTVKDTGIGISKADLAKLMTPFVQLSKLRGTNAANNGTGLGLSICKRLAEKMGGKLWMTSEPGKGTTVGVTLYGVAEMEPASPGAAPCGSATRPAPPPTGLSVLLVDDVAMNLKVLNAIFRRAGVTDTVLVSSGPEALAALAKRSFSFVMTDLWIPGMDGSELAQKIHAIPRFKALSILAVTADVEVRDTFSMEHFAEVVLKPVTINKIKECLCRRFGRGPTA